MQGLPSTFLTEMAKIQLAVLDGTDISKMSRNQVVSHIQTNIEVTVALRLSRWPKL